MMRNPGEEPSTMPLRPLGVLPDVPMPWGEIAAAGRTDPQVDDRLAELARLRAERDAIWADIDHLERLRQATLHQQADALRAASMNGTVRYDSTWQGLAVQARENLAWALGWRSEHLERSFDTSPGAAEPSAHPGLGTAATSAMQPGLSDAAQPRQDATPSRASAPVRLRPDLGAIVPGQEANFVAGRPPGVTPADPAEEMVRTVESASAWQASDRARPSAHASATQAPPARPMMWTCPHGNRLPLPHGHPRPIPPQFADRVESNLGPEQRLSDVAEEALDLVHGQQRPHTLHAHLAGRRAERALRLVEHRRVDGYPLTPTSCPEEADAALDRLADELVGIAIRRPSLPLIRDAMNDGARHFGELLRQLGRLALPTDAAVDVRASQDFQIRSEMHRRIETALDRRRARLGLRRSDHAEGRGAPG